MICLIKILPPARYEVRVSYRIAPLADSPSRRTDSGRSGRRPDCRATHLVAYVGSDAVTASVHVPLGNAHADLLLAAELGEQYYEHPAVPVRTNDPLKEHRGGFCS